MKENQNLLKEPDDGAVIARLMKKHEEYTKDEHRIQVKKEMLLESLGNPYKVIDAIIFYAGHEQIESIFDTILDCCEGYFDEKDWEASLRDKKRDNARKYEERNHPDEVLYFMDHYAKYTDNEKGTRTYVLGYDCCPYCFERRYHDIDDGDTVCKVYATSYEMLWNMLILNQLLSPHDLTDDILWRERVGQYRFHQCIEYASQVEWQMYHSNEEYTDSLYVKGENGRHRIFRVGKH